ncbi:MAG: SDR family oxidoreductase [Dehalococcoidia bacterium]|nr:MAG: SDR family oxidoreductase [Dehalococcoidia bacterium]
MRRPATPVNTGAVLITGASTGIGAAAALHLAALGHRVFAGVRRVEDGEALKRQGGALIHPVVIDVTDPASIDAAVQHVAAATGVGGLGALVNNAGIAVTGAWEHISRDRLRQQFEVNLLGTIAVTQAFLPLVRRGRGRIITISSIAGKHAPPFFGPYAASKHALEAFGDSLRLELRHWRIPVTLIEPGAIDTPIWEKGLAVAGEVLDEMPRDARASYAPYIEAARRSGENAGRRGIPAERVAEVIAHAVRSARPRARYFVGRDARLRALAMRILPDRLIDALTWRGMKMPRRPR